MKRILALSLLLLSSLLRAQDVPQIPVEQLAPRWGFQHTHICTTGDWGCGSNPPTWQIPADGITPGTGPDSGRRVGCGTTYSTSHARNTDGTVSTKGVRILLPTVAMMAAAGISAPYRDGQCEIHIVMGAPGPQQYLRIGVDGVSPDDKFTALPTGAGDMTSGEFIIPYRTPGEIVFNWNGLSWLLGSATPDTAEIFGNGQLAKHGDVRLFRVNADPSWWSVTSRVGTLALCPENGNGVIGPSNGGDMLMRISPTCVFHDPATGGPSNEWITLGFAGAASCDPTSPGPPVVHLEALAQGAAYAAGTAPDGTVYPAGNYIVLKNCNPTNFADGNTITVYSGKSALGSRFLGRWIAKAIGSDLELHEEVTHLGVSAPSSFIAGDTIIPGLVPVFQEQFLSTQGTTSARQMWYADGAEIQGGTTRRTLVGVAQRGPTGFSGTYQDTTSLRLVASLYQPVQKRCATTTAADRTTTSLTYVEMPSGADLRCTFMYLSGIGSQGVVFGDNTSGARTVQYSLQIEASNNTAGDGCQFVVAIDGVAQTPTTGFVNPAGESGRHQFLSIRGSANNLTEAPHTLTLNLKALTGGTCTVYSAGTSQDVTIWQ